MHELSEGPPLSMDLSERHAVMHFTEVHSTALAYASPRHPFMPYSREPPFLTFIRRFEAVASNY